jgi:hypothetical protein
MDDVYLFGLHVQVTAYVPDQRSTSSSRPVACLPCCGLRRQASEFPAASNPAIIPGRFGQDVHSQIRRFVVVRVNRNSHFVEAWSAQPIVSSSYTYLVQFHYNVRWPRYAETRLQPLCAHRGLSRRYSTFLLSRRDATRHDQGPYRHSTS